MKTSQIQSGKAGSFRRIWVLFPEGEGSLGSKPTKDQGSISAHSRHGGSHSQPLSP